MRIEQDFVVHSTRIRLLVQLERLVVGAAAAGLVLCSACRKRSAQESAPPTAGSQPQATAFDGSMMEGVDRSAIRAYLSSVHEVKPKKFDVEWSPDVVPVTREDALRSLHAVSPDGNSYTFAASDPIVQKLQPGRILWLWGMTIARIDLAGTIDSETVVHTVPIPLSDALPRADIEFDAPVDFRSAIARMAPKSATPDSAWKMLTSAPAPSPFRQVVYRRDERGWLQAPEAGNNQSGSTENSGNAENLDQASADEGIVGSTGGGYNGVIMGWEFSMGYGVSGDNLEFELEGRKMEEGGPAAGASNEIARDERHEYYEEIAEMRHAQHLAEEAHERMLKDAEALSQVIAQQGAPVGPTPANASAATKASMDLLRKKDQEDLDQAHQAYLDAESRAKVAQEKAKTLAMMKGALWNVFYIISDNLDVRFRARAELDPTSVAAVVQTAPLGQAISNAGSSVTFNGLKGSVDLEYVTRLGEGGTGDVSIPVAHIPVVFNVPVPVDGIPFIVQFGGDFLFKVGLSGNHAAHHFHAKVNFDGQGGGFTVSSQSQANTNFNLSGTEPEVLETTAESPGVSGVVLAVQAPRLGLGVGVFGLAGMGYFDHVTVVTMTNSAGVGALNPSCKRVSIDRNAHIGSDVTTVLSHPIIEKLVHFAAWKKEVWKSPTWTLTDPDIPMCRI